jgi:hypothetical protein
MEIFSFFSFASLSENKLLKVLERSFKIFKDQKRYTFQTYNFEHLLEYSGFKRNGLDVP